LHQQVDTLLNKRKVLQPHKTSRNSTSEKMSIAYKQQRDEVLQTVILNESHSKKGVAVTSLLQDDQIKNHLTNIMYSKKWKENEIFSKSSNFHRMISNRKEG